MATVVERLELLLTSNAKDAIAGIRQTQLAAADLDAATGQAQKKMGFLGAAAQTAGTHIQQNIGMYSVAAVGALTAAGVASVNAYTDLADKVRDFSRASGASADTASRLVAIFDDLEVSQSAADNGFFKLNRGISDGTVNLEQYGAKVKVAKDGTTDIYGTLLSVADAYKNTEDSGARAALVQEAFGRGGKDLIPILEKGRDGIREMYAAVPDGQILDQGDIDRAREFKLAMDDLGDSVNELKMAAGEALVPVLTDLANQTATMIRTSNEALGPIGGMSNALGATADAALRAVPVVGSVYGITKDLGSVFGIGGQEADKFTESQKRLGDAQKAVAELAAENKMRTDEGRAAKRELAAAEADYEGVARRVTDAIGGQTNAIADNLAKAQEYINTQMGVAGAQLNVEAASNRYNEALFKTGEGSLETRQAAQALEQQTVALGNATYNAAIQSGDSVEDAKAKQVAAYEWVAGTLAPDSPLRSRLQDYIGELKGIPKNLRTAISYTVGPSGGYEGYSGEAELPPGMSQGGWVGGTGNGDTVPAMLTPGEFVLSKDMLAGRASVPFGGSSAGGGAQHVHLSGGPPGFVEWVVSEINNQSRGGPVILSAAVG